MAIRSNNGYWADSMVYCRAVYRKAICLGLTRKVFMVRLKVHELMAARGITAYRLSQGTALTYPSAYRLSRPDGQFGRLHAETLDELCHFFHVQPGRLLQWVPA
jgi:DNA-binding Xre family transcriptional regulator